MKRPPLFLHDLLRRVREAFGASLRSRASFEQHLSAAIDQGVVCLSAESLERSFEGKCSEHLGALISTPNNHPFDFSNGSK